jgi:ketosteroid isomerase-like protein
MSFLTIIQCRTAVKNVYIDPIKFSCILQLINSIFESIKYLTLKIIKMKKLVLVLALIPLVGWSQVKSGVSYSEHPAYDVITKSYQIWESGTEAELRALYAEDAKFWGPGDDEPSNLDQEVSNMLWWQENFSAIKFTVMEGATPDVIKYDDDEKGAWAMDWMVFSAVNKDSGKPVKVNLHTNNYVTNEGKITMSMSHFDRETAGAQIQESFGLHRNGRVYDEHPIIDKLNEMVAHFEAGEISELASYFSEDAEFYRLGVDGKLNLEERIATWHQAVAASSVRKLEQSGYPDAIYYAKDGGQWVVLSWWWVNNTNAETGEKTREYLHLSLDFNSEGKVTREVLYMAN